MTCKKGGFVCIRHDEVRDLTASMLREVCHGRLHRANPSASRWGTPAVQDSQYRPEARVDICARGFWTRGQRTFLNIRIFDPMAASHRELSLEAVHHRNELEKIRAYGDRILQVDHGTFTPLVFTTSGGMAPKARSFYSRLADLMSVKKHQPRSSVAAWMRCRLSFSLLRSALLCLRGTRYSTPSNTDRGDIDCEATLVESGIRVDRLGIE
ncbi:hypothetical protein GWK47_051545 [Chionoecetes opilio]|uniref:Uncharacterized protein n=1 Tax=Chionoecetes opilio TaxID=41210 RepID=A0A8J4Y0T3_CHIOP|nr:hypothetical protein GWK47_051545 [Chionoecetes opilio]